LALMVPYSMGLVSLEFLRACSFWSVLFVALYTVYTGCEYVYANRSYVKKILGF
jgi:CDP-diacylglycerol--glycerol-3-phosphate 3-phosphatidyltransferase